MTPNSSTDSATRDGLEEATTAAKVLVRQLNQAAWNSGNADAEDSWKRQERTAAAQDKLLNETLAAVDTLLAASRAEVERLRAEVPRWISPQDEMPPPLTTVPTLSKEKRSTTGWAHSYGCWNDDPDDNSRPDSKMFKAQTAYWCRLPMLPENPSNRSTTPKG